MLRNPVGWAEVMDRLAVLCDSLKPDLIVGIKARGFIVGMGLATHKKLGFVPEAWLRSSPQTRKTSRQGVRN